MIVVSRGEAIAKLLGLGGLRIKVFPVMVGPLGLATPFNPPPPLPSSITVEFLPPIEWRDLGPDAAADRDVVERCGAEVTGAMQEALNRLASNGPTRSGGASPISCSTDSGGRATSSHEERGMTKRVYRTNAQRRRALQVWLRRYNTERPHSALGGRPPISRLS